MTKEEGQRPATRQDLEDLRKLVVAGQRRTRLEVAVGLGVGLLLIGAAAFYLNKQGEERVERVAAEGLVENVVAERQSCERLDDVRNLLYQVLNVATAQNNAALEESQTPEERAAQAKLKAYFRSLVEQLVTSIKPKTALETSPDKVPKDGLPDEIHVNCERAFPVPNSAVGYVTPEEILRQRLERELEEMERPRDALSSPGPEKGARSPQTTAPGSEVTPESGPDDSVQEAPPVSGSPTNGGGGGGGGGNEGGGSPASPKGPPPPEAPPSPSPAPAPAPSPPGRETPIRDALCPPVEAVTPGVADVVGC